MTLTDQMREQIARYREYPIHTGEVYDVDDDGITVAVGDEDPTGPHAYEAAGPVNPGDACVVLDTAEGDRFVLCMNNGVTT